MRRLPLVLWVPLLWSAACRHDSEQRETPATIDAAVPHAPPPATVRSPEAVRAVLAAEMALIDGDAATAVQHLKEATLFDAGSSTIFARMADAYLMLDDGEHARAAAQRAVQLAPKNADAAWALARSNDALGLSTEAARAAKSAAQLGKRDVAVVSLLMRVALEHDDERAADEAVTLLADTSAPVRGHVLLARMLLADGRFDEARTRIDAALRIAPDNSEAHEAARDIAWVRFDDDAALVAAKKCADADDTSHSVQLLAALYLANKQQQANDAVNDWLRADDSVAAHLNIATAMLAAGEGRLAMRLLQSGVAQAPTEVQLAYSTAAQLAGAEAEAATQMACGRVTQLAVAAACFAITARSGPAPMHAHAERTVKAALRQAIDATDDDALLAALTAYRTLLAAGGNLDASTSNALAKRVAHDAHPALLVAAVEVWLAGGQVARASDVAQEALREHPNDTERTYLYARVLDASGQRGLARDLVTRLLAREPDGTDAVFVYQNFVAFSRAEDRTDSVEAVQLAKRALSRQPLSPAVLDTLGWAQFAAGDTDNAKRTLLRAVRLAPNEGEILFHIASVEHAQNDPRAAEHAQQALALLPTNHALVARIRPLLQRDSGARVD